MNHSPFWPLVWKEYRAGRAFWLSMAVMGLAAQASVAWFVNRPVVRNWWLFEIALIFSAGFAVGIGGTLFAVENEERTIALLRTLPVRARQLGTAKMFAAVASLIALVGLLWVTARAMGGQTLAPGEAGELWSGWGLACLEGLAWGILCSLCVRHALRATVMAAGAVVLANAVAVWATERYHSTGSVIFTATIPFRTAVLVLVLAADAVLLPYWLTGRRQAWLPFWRGTWYFKSARMRSLAHLVWQTVREGRGRLLILIAASVACLVLYVRAHLRTLEFQPIAFWSLREAIMDDPVSLVLVPGMLVAFNGLMVFRGDQLNGPRFLAARGVSPRLVWLARQLVWGCWLWALIAIFAVVIVWAVGLTSACRVLGISPNGNPLPRWIGNALEFAVAAVLMLLPAYAAGQFASLIARRGVLAVTLGLLLGGLMTFWTWLMESLGVPWVWSVLPLALGMLLATWLRLPGWLMERSSPRYWLAPLAAVVVPAAALAVAVPRWRVEEIPQPTAAVALPSPVSGPTAAGQATLELYGRAWDLSQRSPAQADQEDAWRKSVADLVIEASGSDANLLALPLATRLTAAPKIHQLQTVLFEFANRLLAGGDLDGALDAYLSGLRLEAQLHQCDGSLATFTGEILARLRTWAAAPGQTVERIDKASRQLAEWYKSLPAPEVWILPLYQVSQFAIDDLPAAAARQSGSTVKWAAGVFDKSLTDLDWLSSRLPWERSRAHHLIDQLAAQQITDARAMREALAENQSIDTIRLYYNFPYNWPDLEWHDYATWLRTTPLAKVDSALWESLPWLILCQETDYRATVIVLALEAWRVEHGQLPQRLDELVGPGRLETLPLDPLWARPFLYYPAGLSEADLTMPSLPPPGGNWAIDDQADETAGEGAGDWTADDQAGETEVGGAGNWPIPPTGRMVGPDAIPIQTLRRPFLWSALNERRHDQPIDLNPEEDPQFPYRFVGWAGRLPTGLEALLDAGTIFPLGPKEQP